MTSRITSKVSGLAVAAALSLAFVGGAQAASVTYGSQSTNGVGNTADTFAALYGANTPLAATWTADPTVANPPLSVAGDYKSPFLNTPLADTNSYFAADTRNASNGNGITTMAELTYSSTQYVFNMLWGSVDRGDGNNVITFYKNGTEVFQYTGAQVGTDLGLTNPAGSPVNSLEEVVKVKFADFADGFDKVTFESGRPAFEFALAPVPVPAAGLLLLTALGGIAALRRRKAA